MDSQTAPTPGSPGLPFAPPGSHSGEASPPDRPGVPDRSARLKAVRREAAGCRNCPLWEIGTQTVFGDGPAGADLIFLGEAPGYQEDRAGRPFVGPAGQVFDEALAAAEIDRSRGYVTNTVKHRPWTPGGRQGINRPPKQSEINACRPWLDQELAILRPRRIVCLGAIAAKAVLGKTFRLTQDRGRWIDVPALGVSALATFHPSYILKQRPPARDAAREAFFADLRAVAEGMRE